MFPYNLAKITSNVNQGERKMLGLHEKREADFLVVKENPLSLFSLIFGHWA